MGRDTLHAKGVADIRNWNAFLGIWRGYFVGHHLGADHLSFSDYKRGQLGEQVSREDRQTTAAETVCKATVQSKAVGSVEQ